MTYQVVWTRSLSLVFGVGVVAATAVLTSFMGGLALGSWVVGRYSDRIKRPLAWYGGLQMAIALSGLLFPASVQLLQQFYVSLHNAIEGSEALIGLARFLLSLLILLAPTSLMGGTLPLLASGAKTSLSESGLRVGWLYSVNTLGAVLGCFSAGFIFLGTIGMRNLLFGAAAINILIAVVSLILGWRPQEKEASKQEVKRDSLDMDTTLADVRWLLVAMAMAGFAGLAYEILWMRMLVFFLWGSVYAFTAMLTTFLVGLGLGSLVMTHLADRLDRPDGVFGLLQALVGFTACLTLPIFVVLFPWLKETWSDFALASWGSPNYLKFVKSFLVMILPTLLMGASFPVAVRCYVHRLDKMGSDVGRLYACNTFGAMGGAAFATFVMLPLFGAHRAILCISGLNAAAAVLALTRLPRGSRLGWAITGVLGLQIILCLALFPREMILKSEGEDGPVLYYKDGAMATVKVWETFDGSERHLSINGYPVAGVAPDYAEVQKMLAHLPCLLQSTGPESVMIIGFGTGGTSWGVTLHEPAWVECVELVPGVPEAAEWFADKVNHHVLKQDGFHLILEDGRNRVLTTRRSYDVITVDATSPKHAGNGSLYALEFYVDCRKKLTEQGLLAQWLPFHLLTEEEVRIILSTMRQIFPHTTVWLTSRRWYALALGTLTPMRIDYQELDRRMANPALLQDLEDLDIHGPDDLLACFVMGEMGLKDYCGNVPLNTDDHPIIEYYRYNTDWGVFPFPGSPESVPVFNVPADRREGLVRAIEISRLLTRASYLYAHWDPMGCKQLLDRVLEIDPENKGALDLLGQWNEVYAPMLRQQFEAPRSRSKDENRAAQLRAAVQFGRFPALGLVAQETRPPGPSRLPAQGTSRPPA